MTTWTPSDLPPSRERTIGIRGRLLVALAGVGLLLVACHQTNAAQTLSTRNHVTSPTPSAVASVIRLVPQPRVTHVTHVTPAATPIASVRSHRPVAPATPAPTTCGAPANPWGYNFCGRGSYISSPASGVCSYFACIGNFGNGVGYMVECADGKYSMSGGRSGACSYHGGEKQPVFSGSGPH